MLAMLGQQRLSASRDETKMGLRLGHFDVHSMQCLTHGEAGFVKVDERTWMCAACHREVQQKERVLSVVEGSGIGNVPMDAQED